jgi:hypothetical protein
MVSVHARVWPPLENRSSEAFLVAGTLLLASPAHLGIELVGAFSLTSWVVALFVFPGLFAALVGVSGLYPQLADQSPRLALTAGVITTSTGAMLVGLLGWILGASLLNAVSTLSLGMPPDIAFVTLSVSMTLSFLSFGIASLRSAAPSRAVGLLLLSFATPWILAVAATLVYGSTFPEWLLLLIYGPVPLIMLATGYTLRTPSTLTAEDDTAVDVTTG